MIKKNRIFLIVYGFLLNSVNSNGLVWETLPPGFNEHQPNSILGTVKDHYSKLNRPKLPFSHMYLFGDSSCDTGNFARFNRYLLPNPKIYWQGRFSNGPMWPDYFSVMNDIPVKNFCHGGAVVSIENSVLQPGIPDFRGQIDLYGEDQYDNVERPLGVVEFVGNDLLGPNITAIKVVKDFETATQILIDMGEIKDYIIILGPGELYNSKGYNRELKKSVARLKSSNPDINIHYMMTLEEIYLMLAVPPPNSNPVRWGVRVPCYNETSGFVCRDPENHFLFDFYHFTTVPYFNLAARISRFIAKVWEV